MSEESPPHAPAGPLDLVAYRVTDRPAFKLVRAPVDRDWMDATGEHFAYRCLPLNIANTHGWMVLNDVGFKAMWTGGWDKSSVKVAPLDEEGATMPAFGHFGSGVLTFHMPWLFRTPPGWNLHAHRPANVVKDAIVPLEGIIETDWAVSPFTFNWRFNAKHVWTEFKKGDPICMLTPVKRGELERFTPREVQISDNPELQAAYDEWRASRGEFLRDLGKPGTEATAAKWQRHYFRGMQPDGKTAPGHQTRVELKEFKMLPRAQP